jgi:transposase-like protein
MAREQFTFYAEAEDIAEWKERAKPYPLNRWIREVIRQHLEGGNHSRSAGSDHAEEIAALKRQNTELLDENKRLSAQLNNQQSPAVVAFDDDTEELLREVVSTIRSGRAWSSAQVIKKFVPPVKTRMMTKDVEERINRIVGVHDNWVIVDIVSEKKKQMTSEPDEDEIKAFKDSLHYTSVRVVKRDIANKTLVIRPKDSAGMDDRNEDIINLMRVKAIGRTLNELESLGIIRNIASGYVWNK